MAVGPISSGPGALMSIGGSDHSAIASVSSPSNGTGGTQGVTFNQLQPLNGGITASPTSTYPPPVIASSVIPSPSNPSTGMGASVQRVDTKMAPNPAFLHSSPPSAMRTRYMTRSSGTAPPPSCSSFVVVDEGNCSPRFLRSSLYRIPNEKDVLNKLGLPFGIIAQPLAEVGVGEHPVPLVEMNEPVRCRRCNGYINPFDEFIDGGSKYRCFLCECINEVPDFYFSPLQINGLRSDLAERPELTLGSVDFLVGDKFNFRPPHPMALLIAIDVSRFAFKTPVAGVGAASASVSESSSSSPSNPGYLPLLCKSLISIFQALEKADSPIYIALMTYSSGLHFYDLSRPDGVPQMFQINDLTNPFLPTGNDPEAIEKKLLLPLKKAMPALISLLEKLPLLHPHHEAQSAMGSAIQACRQLLHHRGGKIILFQSTLPNAGLGALPNRLTAKSAADDERKLLKPQSNFYIQEAQLLLASRIGVDLFFLPQAYIDVATLLPLSHITFGNCHYFLKFNGTRDRFRLHNDLYRSMSRLSAGYDSILCVRTSPGVVVSKYYGLPVTNQGDLDAAIIDCHSSFAFELQYDEKVLDPKRSVHGVQVATLFTSIAGKRILRVHTLGIISQDQMSDVFRAVDADATVSFLMRRVIHYALQDETALQDLRNQLTEVCVNTLSAYRKFASSSASSKEELQKLLLPESLKLLPCYLISAVKTKALRQAGRFVNVDERPLHWHQILQNFSVADQILQIYPRMFALHSLPIWAGKAHPEDPSPSSSSFVLPPWNRLTAPLMESNGIYLLDDGHQLVVWIGKDASPNLLTELFNQPTLQAIDVEGWTTQILSSSPTAEYSDSLFSAVHRIISSLQKPALVPAVHSYKTLFAIRQTDPQVNWFQLFLVEDKLDYAMSYPDYLCLIHSLIRKKLG